MLRESRVLNLRADMLLKVTRAECELLGFIWAVRSQNSLSALHPTPLNSVGNDIQGFTLSRHHFNART